MADVGSSRIVVIGRDLVVVIERDVAVVCDSVVLSVDDRGDDVRGVSDAVVVC